MNYDFEMQQSLNYLQSEEAIKSVCRDPYWPKWDSPWWHMLAFFEMGLSEKIPMPICEAMIASMNLNYYKYLPIDKENVPTDADKVRNFPCHCSLGSMYQLLFARGVDVDAQLAWIRPWFLKYQLPDGGLNCDEEAYKKTNPKSSIVSTLPAMEAILYCTNRTMTSEEIDYLDRGANYLIEHELFRKKSDNSIISKQWLKLCFPRFYKYDVLRGLTFLVNWATLRNKRLPTKLVTEATNIIKEHEFNGALRIGRSSYLNEKNYSPIENKWDKSDASDFLLLHSVGKIGEPSPYLTKIWLRTLVNLKEIAA